MDDDTSRSSRRVVRSFIVYVWLGRIVFIYWFNNMINNLLIDFTKVPYLDTFDHGIENIPPVL